MIRLQLLTKYPKLEVRSVDGFQGREKEAVILSLVRSNPNGEVGFLAESRRLNVAVTRGRRHVAVICDSETVSHDKFLKEFVEYLQEKADVRSAMLYERRDLERPEGLELTVKDEVKSKGQKVKGEAKKKKTASQKEEKKEIVKPKPEVKKDDEIVMKESEEERTQAKRDHFEDIIETFIHSDKVEYSFSPKLNSHDRLLVHEIAEELGLIHESTGEAKKRHIILKKKVAKLVPKSETEATKSDSLTVTCSTCLATVPKSNIELHKLRCRPTPSAPEKPKSSKGKKKSSKSCKNVDEEDLDKLLESFNKLDNVCNQEKCKEKISVLGVTCPHCRTRFCLSHGMPEVHGCGDAAKREARRQIGRDGKLFPGSGRPDFKPDAVKKKQLQKKLDKKIGEMEEERRAKKKETKK